MRNPQNSLIIVEAPLLGSKGSSDEAEGLIGFRLSWDCGFDHGYPKGPKDPIIRYLGLG